ncbi:MAG: 30S ribosomal protein S17 [Candidatus Nealsonbacteria bacterium]|nr:30S ribosomal protein S17 [Candidatus Nealsonbacteria bacterium]
MPKKRLKGIVTSDKMKKTVVVRVESWKEFPKYKRKYKFHKKYKAHDEKEKSQVGDKVLIEEAKPFSKEKRWKVVKILEHREIRPEEEEIEEEIEPEEETVAPEPKKDEPVEEKENE